MSESTHPILDRQQVEVRLLLVKEVSRRAKKLEEHNEVEFILAIQLLDFAVETLLRTIAFVYQHPAGTKLNERSPFPELVRHVNDIYADPNSGIKNNRSLPLVPEIEELHHLRNEAQHRGNAPNPDVLQRNKEVFDVFVSSVLRDAFDTRLELLLSAKLIKDKQLRKELEKSETALNSGDYRTCVISASKAFESAEDMRTSRVVLRQRSSSIPITTGNLVEVQRHINQLSDDIGDLREAVLSVIRGLSKEDLARFHKISLKTSSPLAIFMKEKSPYVPSPKEAEWVFRFVLDALLNWGL